MFLLSSILAYRQEEEISKIWQQKKTAYGGRETEQTQEGGEIQTEKSAYAGRSDSGQTRPEKSCSAKSIIYVDYFRPTNQTLK